VRPAPTKYETVFNLKTAKALGLEAALAGIRHGRRHHRQGPSPRTGRKRGTQSPAIGRSKGGMTTKILALTDALGNHVRFVLLPGHRFDTVGVAPLIDGLAFEGFIADKAFDSNSIIADLNERGAKIVISQHPRAPRPCRSTLISTSGAT
jgi:Transposase DDE domain